MLVLLAARAAVAGPTSSRLEMRESDGATSLGCHDEHHEAATVELELRSDHGLTVVATGTRTAQHTAEHRWTEGDLGHDDCYEKRVSIAWTTRWTGTWAATSADAMMLDLTVAGDTCKRTLERSTLETDADDVPCIAASKHTRMTCRRTLAPIDGPEFPAGQRPVWDCAARGLGVTPSRWVFGMKGCVQARGLEHVVDCATKSSK
ncbi:MAG TPA: hypothetical protein VMJ10_30985 [Kofleriaceae bacterium]|nr:hypothetical protein [Kofleriaceae bacterium]